MNRYVLLKMNSLYLYVRRRSKLLRIAGLPLLPAIAATLFIILLYVKLLQSNDNSGNSQLPKRGERNDANTLLQIQELSEKISRLQAKLKGSDNTDDTSDEVHSSPGSCNCNTTLQVPTCEVLHISVVCAEQQAVHEVVILIKSILFYRKNPLHFHFISDETGKLILETMFESWHLRGVETSFYQADSYKSDLTWMLGRNTSDVFRLINLIITNILPSDLDKTIVLDKNLIFTTDIAHLWRFFLEFTGTKAIGVVDDDLIEHDGKTCRSSPTSSSNINPEVMLLDLKKLRDNQWIQMLKKETDKELRAKSLPKLINFKDIFKAAVGNHPDLIHTLTCVWNVRFDQSNSSKKCQADITDLTNIKVIHRIPKKMQTSHKYFHNFYSKFLQYNGQQLRRELFSCPEVIDSVAPHVELDESDECYRFRRDSSVTYRIHQYFVNFEYKPVSSGFDVTYVAQLHMEKIVMLEELCKNWKGPMSLALYLTETEAQELLTYVSGSKTLSRRKNIGYHVVYKHGKTYPYNYLRNVALKHVTTPYVFLSNIDFLPKQGMYQYQVDMLKTLRANISRTALVIPAFETWNLSMPFPKSKADLIHKLDTGEVLPFQNDTFAKGQAPTNFTKWRSAQSVYKVQYESRFEPHVVLNSHCPQYDVRFLGYVGNKISHIFELHIQGYEFWVSPDAYVLHLPHGKSSTCTNLCSSKLYERCYAILEREFGSNLLKKYHPSLFH